MALSRGGADLLLEWCSARRGGTKASFESACRSVLGDFARPTQLLHEMELLGHLEVDWVHSGHWWVTPTVLSYVDGSGGNAVLIGARSGTMLSELQELADAGISGPVSFVWQGDLSPTAVFVAVEMVDGIEAIGRRISANSRANVRLEYRDALVPLQSVLDAAVSEYTSSGVQAKRLDTPTLSFEPCEILHGRWVPGCYEQMSYGMRRYLFVGDDRRLHNTDRWSAIHAELNRVHRIGDRAINPVSWSPDTQSLFCDARAQLPIMWARAAVMCTGLLPVRHREADGHYVDEFRGVHDTTYRRIADTLGYAVQRAMAGQERAS